MKGGNRLTSRFDEWVALQNMAGKKKIRSCKSGKRMYASRNKNRQNLILYSLPGNSYFNKMIDGCFAFFA